MNKKFKLLLPSICMMLVSAMLVGTSTFAWFSMNTQVTATGMRVKAQAEGGIVISNESKSDWKASAAASHVIKETTLVAAELIPISTADVRSWYHAVSNDANNYAKATGTNYTSYSTSATGDSQITEPDGVGSVSAGDKTKAIYLKNIFYIQSSADELMLGEDALYINSVTATTTTTNTANLNKSLRVAIVMSDSAGTKSPVIFAPVSGGATTYSVNGSSTTVIAAGTLNTKTSIKTIPAYTKEGTNAITASIYIYFEGEDPECKSANLASVIDTLDVQVVFGTTKIEGSDTPSSNKVSVTYNIGENLTCDGGVEATKNAAFTGTLKLTDTAESEGYVLPETITVKVGSEELEEGADKDYEYTSSNGKFTIKSSVITDNITITASAQLYP